MEIGTIVLNNKGSAIVTHTQLGNMPMNETAHAQAQAQTKTHNSSRDRQIAITHIHRQTERGRG